MAQVSAVDRYRQTPNPEMWGQHVAERELSTAIDHLRNLADGAEAVQMLYDTAVQLPMIAWSSVHETPQQFLPGVHSQPWWDEVHCIKHQACHGCCKTASCPTASL